jgi:hypothetical protein
MAVTALLSNHFKYQAYHKQIDLANGGDEIVAILMRSGWVFDKDTHAKKINVITNSGSIGTLTFANAGNTLTRGAGNFVTDGFVVGMYITTNSANANNQGPLKISNVATGALTVTTTAGGDPTLTDGAESNITVTSADELETGFGYTQDTMVLTSQALAEDDTNDRAAFTAADIEWTADGGSIGPTPGCILYDNTDTDKTIIGYINFGAEQTVSDGGTFTISGEAIYLT